ncbi:subtilisin-like serine protease [Eggerthella sp. YY7918]|nr:subtilisin-like serine protease [Eggerthella sp. YY7918]
MNRINWGTEWTSRVFEAFQKSSSGISSQSASLGDVKKPFHSMISMLLSIVLVSGLLPIFPHNQAFANDVADNVADTTAQTVQKNDGKVIIVYENEALALDEPVSVEGILPLSVDEGEFASEGEGNESEVTPGSSQNAETTLQDMGVVEQEEIAPVTEEQGAVAVAQLSDGITTEEAIQQLEETPGIAYVQPNYSYSLLTTTISDPYCVTSRDASTDNQQYLFDSKIIDAWDYAKVEGSVTVAVIDTGCNLNHPDLQGTIDAANAYDVTSGMPLGQSGVANGGDANGHGTLVSGVIAAQANNGQGIAGASYNANILPIKVFDENNICTSADIIAAYAYLDGLLDAGSVPNLRVINMSLGYYSEGGDEADEALRQSIASMLTEHDVLTVCAGGNGDASGQANTATCYPSDFEECLSVTALDESGANASFSDYNAAKDIGAPGVNILSTDVSGDYSMATGSSMAAPQVASVAALLWAAAPSMPSSQVMETLKSTASEVTGNVHEESGSAGALNAQAAVAQVLGIAIEGDQAQEGNGESEETDDNNPAGSAPDAEFEEPTNDKAEPSSQQQELRENSWRYKDGERIYSNEGANTASEISLFSIITNPNGFKVRDWFDQFSSGYYTGTDAYKGIDVSEHNGTVDWAKVKSSGVQYAIIRCGYGNNESNQDDRQWLNNVRGCLANNIPFGVYIYSYATNTTMATSEAQHVLRLLSQAGLDPASLSYPVYFDMEDGSTIGSNYAAIASTFCSKIEAAGYSVGIYANKNWFTNYLTDSCFNKWTKWVAEWNATSGLTYDGLSNFASGNGMWQFSDYGKVPGINARVDLNYTYMLPKGTSVIEDKYTVPSAPYATPVKQGEYLINSALSNSMVADIESASDSNGANLQLYTSNMTAAQRFKISPDRNGFYSITNLKSGKALGLKKYFTGQYGANVAQYDIDSSDNSQKWIIVENPDGSMIVKSAINPAYVLDVAAANTANGTNIQLYISNGSNAQKWNFISTNISVSGSKTINDGLYVIGLSAKQSVVFDIAAGSLQSGANLQAHASNRSSAQKFYFVYDGSGFYTITNLKSGMALEAVDGNLVNGTNVRQAAPTKSDAQKWAVSKNGDGTYTFTCKASGLAIDVARGSTANGTNIQTHVSNSSAAQKFVVTSAVEKRTITDGEYLISSALKGSSVCDISRGSIFSGANLQLHESNMTDAQKFKLQYDSQTGFYIITNTKSGKVLDIESAKVANSTNVRQYDSNNTLAQRWIVSKNSDGTLTIASAINPAYVLDVAAANTANGTNIQLYISNGTKAQEWNFVSWL